VTSTLPFSAGNLAAKADRAMNQALATRSIPVTPQGATERVRSTPSWSPPNPRTTGGARRRVVPDADVRDPEVSYYTYEEDMTGVSSTS